MSFDSNSITNGENLKIFKEKIDMNYWTPEETKCKYCEQYGSFSLNEKNEIVGGKTIFTCLKLSSKIVNCNGSIDNCVANKTNIL